MSRASARTLILALLAAVAVIGAAWFAYAALLLHVPLEGITSHDFGEVMLRGDGETRVEHTFHLVNASGEPIALEAVKSECGCVVAPVQPRTIAPGEALDLPVTMIVPVGSKTVAINLLLGDAGRQRLKVSATGLPQSRLWATSGGVTLPRAGSASPTTLAIGADIYRSYEQPPPPRIEAPPGVEARFNGWTQTWKPDDPRKVPVKWEGAILVMLSDTTALPEDANIVLTLPGVPPVNVPLRLE